MTDIKDFFACDAETLLNTNHSDYHAHLEIEPAFHAKLDDSYLSLFTKRDGAGKTEYGTQVWLDTDSVTNLIGEMAKWAMANGVTLSEIASQVGLNLVGGEEEEEEESEDDPHELLCEGEDFTYGFSKDWDECPYCGSDQVHEYRQADWDEAAVWCNACSNVISDGDGTE